MMFTASCVLRARPRARGKGLPKLDGSLWHAYKRKSATSRKGLPDVDVAVAGGWSDLTSLKTAYQQADTETLYRVVSEPMKLREVR